MGRSQLTTDADDAMNKMKGRAKHANQAGKMGAKEEAQNEDPGLLISFIQALIPFLASVVPVWSRVGKKKCLQTCGLTLQIVNFVHEDTNQPEWICPSPSSSLCTNDVL